MNLAPVLTGPEGWEPHNYPHTRVAMQAWEVQMAGEIGARRLVANLHKGDAPHYDRSKMQSDWIAQPAAVLCEAAAAKWLDRYYDWSAWDATTHHRHKDGGDVGGVEVRRVRTQPAVAVRQRDAAKGVEIVAAYVDMDNPTEVLVYGLIDARWAWAYYHSEQVPTRDWIRAPITWCENFDVDYQSAKGAGP